MKKMSDVLQLPVVSTLGAHQSVGLGYLDTDGTVLVSMGNGFASAAGGPHSVTHYLEDKGAVYVWTVKNLSFERADVADWIPYEQLAETTSNKPAAVLH